jgi:hypothetical protein
LLFSSATDAVSLAIDATGKVYLAGAGSTPTIAKRGTGTSAEWNKIDPTVTPPAVIDNVQPGHLVSADSSRTGPRRQRYRARRADADNRKQPRPRHAD